MVILLEQVDRPEQQTRVVAAEDKQVIQLWLLVVDLALFSYDIKRLHKKVVEEP
jgi:hypothetical protein